MNSQCGRGNMETAANTEVLDVVAGDTIEVAHTRSGPDRWTSETFDNCPYDRGSCDPINPNGVSVSLISPRF
jgi:hypothetical protein